MSSLHMIMSSLHMSSLHMGSLHMGAVACGQFAYEQFAYEWFRWRIDMSGSRVRRGIQLKIYCNLSPNAIAHAQRFHSHGAAGATFLWRGHTSRAACHLHAVAASSWSSVGTFQLASLRSRPLSACWYVIGRKRTCIA